MQEPTEKQTYCPSDNKWTDWEKATEESFNNSATRKKAEKDRRQLSEDKWRFQCSAVLRYHICQFDGPHISHAWNNLGCELPCDLPVCTVIPWRMCSLGYHPRVVSSSCSQPALGLLLLTTHSVHSNYFPHWKSCLVPKKEFCRWDYFQKGGWQV